MLSESGLEVKKKLEGLNQHKRRIRNLKNELRELIELGTIPQVSTGMPSGKGGHPNSIQEKYLIRIETLQEKLEVEIDRAIEEEDAFLKSISSLDSLSQNLLMERYLQGKSLRKIVREFNYDKRHLYRLYNKSFERLSEKLDKIQGWH